MGNTMPFIDILIFAVIAVFLIFRLRSILGNRDGFEKPQKTVQTESSADNIINFKGKTPGAESVPLNGSGLKELRKLDASFRDEEFLSGAKAAFPLILNAYSESDLGSLRRYVGFDLYEEFSNAVHQRDAAGEHLKIDIETVNDVQLLDAEISDGIATVTVKYDTIQSRILTDARDTVIEEDTISSEQIEDIWIFERDIRSTDPNWRLVETGTAETE
jgi:predicted lipid-binding transport protein (Tim44 family)